MPELALSGPSRWTLMTEESASLALMASPKVTATRGDDGWTQADKQAEKGDQGTQKSRGQGGRSDSRRTTPIVLKSVNQTASPF